MLWFGLFAFLIPEFLDSLFIILLSFLIMPFCGYSESPVRILAVRRRTGSEIGTDYTNKA